jgi:hypothetical protein
MLGASPFGGRVLHVSFHQLLDIVADGYHDPGAFSPVGHEYVVALLRILPQIEHLRRGCHIFLGTLPAKICIDS